MPRMRTDRDPALTAALKEAGGVSMVAKELGISPQAISQWDHCPVQHVLALEELCGRKVRRWELRPDIYPRPGNARSQFDSPCRAAATF